MCVDQVVGTTGELRAGGQNRQEKRCRNEKLADSIIPYLEHIFHNPIVFLAHCFNERVG